MPHVVSSHLAQALRAHRHGSASEALGLYAKRLAEAPDCIDSWMNIGAIHAQSGRAREAIEAFERAAKLAPENARVFRDVGLGYKTVGRLFDAAQALERSVLLDPELVGSWLHLARIRLEETGRPEAVDAAQHAVQLRPNNSSAQFLLARCLFDPLRPDAALAAFRLAADSPQGHVEAELFHWLLRHHRTETGAPRLGATPELPDLSRYPGDPRELADAIAYVQREMTGARLLSSARQVIKLAADQAPATGNVLELGVFHGVSLRWLLEYRPGVVHGFDSFVGLPTDWAPVREGTFTTAGRVPVELDCEFWVGTFEKQLPLYTAKHAEPIALLHIDSDLYESAHCALRHLGPLLQPGSVVLFDEYFGHRSWRSDEFLAFQEAVEAHDWRYEYLAANPFTGQVVIRLLS